jgi:hypothetical protein
VRGDVDWRLAFVGGPLAAPLAWRAFAAAPRLHMAASTPVLMAAGLLVGLGTRLGSGCTKRTRRMRHLARRAALGRGHRHLHRRPRSGRVQGRRLRPGDARRDGHVRVRRAAPAGRTNGGGAKIER